VIARSRTCPIGEVARLGRTLRAWRAQVLAYFDTGGRLPTPARGHQPDHRETRRLAHGFRTFTHNRLRILLATDGTRPTAEPTPYA
jgi:transposase